MQATCHKFKVRLGYRMSSRQAWGELWGHLKTKKQTKQRKGMCISVRSDNHFGHLSLGEAVSRSDTTSEWGFLESSSEEMVFHQGFPLSCLAWEMRQLSFLCLHSVSIHPGFPLQMLQRCSHLLSRNQCRLALLLKLQAWGAGYWILWRAELAARLSFSKSQIPSLWGISCLAPGCEAL